MGIDRVNRGVVDNECLKAFDASCHGKGTEIRGVVAVKLQLGKVEIVRLDVGELRPPTSFSHLPSVSIRLSFSFSISRLYTKIQCF